MADFTNKYSFGYLVALIDVVTNDLEELTKKLALVADDENCYLHNRAMKTIKHKETLLNDLKFIKEHIQD